MPRIKSFEVYDIMKVLSEYYNIKLEIEEISRRPGEKIHEDMISPVEVGRTYMIEDLLVVLPEISSRKYSYKDKYEGPGMNSKFFVERDHEKILQILKRGINL